MKPAIPRALSALVFLFALWWAHQHCQGDFLEQLSCRPFGESLRHPNLGVLLVFGVPTVASTWAAAPAVAAEHA